MAISDVVVEVAFASDTLATPTYTDVTDYVVTINIQRGRGSQLGEFPAGSCSIVFNNDDGRFDPDNTGSPYRSGGATQVLPRKRVRVRHSSTDLFVGFGLQRDSWEPSYDAGNVFATMALNAHDYLGILAVAELDETAETGAFDLPSTRLTSIFDEVGAPLSTDLDTGVTLLAATTGGVNAGQAARDVVLAEGGALYVTADGTVTFDARHAPFDETRMTTSQHTFNDSGATPFRDLERGYSDDLFNRVRVTAVGGAEQVVEDSASQTDFGLAGHTADNLRIIAAADAEALSRAEFWLAQYKDPVFHPSVIELHPRDSSDANILTQAITRKLRDRITVAFTPVGGAGAVSHDCYIEAIAHVITVRPGEDWVTTVGLSSAERIDNLPDPFRLDDATDGLLDTSQLGY